MVAAGSHLYFTVDNIELSNLAIPFRITDKLIYESHFQPCHSSKNTTNINCITTGIGIQHGMIQK